MAKIIITRYWIAVGCIVLLFIEKDVDPTVGSNKQKNRNMEKKMLKPNYGNWIPKTLMRILYAVAAVLAVVVLGVVHYYPAGWLIAIASVLFVAVLSVCLYMQLCRHSLSFTGGGVMAKIHGYLLDHLNWDGQGRLLDIGCGSGALSIRCAKKFGEARITGIDYWGMGWDYAQQQCERNAEIEGVAERTHFQKGDASRLDFADESFDAAVSNFVFHEVRSQPDKQQLVREALRVVRKGGAFAFLDLFAAERIYGNIGVLIDALKAEGIAEIHYIPKLEKTDLLPAYMSTPWMMWGVGMIYGRK